MPEIGTEPREWYWGNRRLGLTGGHEIRLDTLVLVAVPLLVLLFIGIGRWANWMVEQDVKEQTRFCANVGAERIDGPTGEGSYVCVRDGDVVYP